LRADKPWARFVKRHLVASLEKATGQPCVPGSDTGVVPLRL
jgi:hypothetical protein